MRSNRSIFGLAFQPDIAPELIRMIRRVMEGIAVHAIEIDPDEAGRFRTDIREIAGRITAEATPEDRVLATGETLKALQDYARSVRSLAEAQRNELLTVISRLTKIVSSTVSSGTASQLGILERKLEGVRAIEDIRFVRLQLTDCLQIARQEIARQRELAAEAQAALSSARAEAASLASQVRSQDFLTGLPNRRVAEDLLTTNCGRRGAFAAVIVMSRVHAINARYGVQVGDEMIRHTARQLVQDLHGFAVHRWGGPSFLAFTETEDSLQMTQSRLRTIPPLQISNSAGGRERSLMLPVSTSWTVYALEHETGIDSIVPKLDSFVAAQIGPLNGAAET